MALLSALATWSSPPELHGGAGRPRGRTIPDINRNFYIYICNSGNTRLSVARLQQKGMWNLKWVVDGWVEIDRGDCEGPLNGANRATYFSFVITGSNGRGAKRYKVDETRAFKNNGGKNRFCVYLGHKFERKITEDPEMRTCPAGWVYAPFSIIADPPHRIDIDTRYYEPDRYTLRINADRSSEVELLTP